VPYEIYEESIVVGSCDETVLKMVLLTACLLVLLQQPH